MPAGGASGPDGLRPTHIKQIFGFGAGALRKRALSTLRDFCNTCLKGRSPAGIRPLFFGASLCALKKKDGGLRPIAIGLVMRRLISRACCLSFRDQAAKLLSPVQLGIGVKGGAEAAAHATRRFLSNCSNESGLVKLDFCNALCKQKSHGCLCQRTYSCTGTIPDYRLRHPVTIAVWKLCHRFFLRHTTRRSTWTVDFRIGYASHISFEHLPICRLVFRRRHNRRKQK